MRDGLRYPLGFHLVTVESVIARDIPLQLQAAGTVMPFQSVAIKSRIESQIVEVKFQDAERDGQTLAFIRLIVAA